MRIRPATLPDAHYLKSRLRQSDRTEIHAATGRSPLEIVPLSYAMSTVCNAILTDDDDRPVALYGVAPGTDGSTEGIVWMLCTPRIREVSKSILRHAPKLLKELQAHYPKLHNIVHGRNALSVRWLVDAGFILRERITFNGEPFIYFTTPGEPPCVTP